MKIVLVFSIFLLCYLASFIFHPARIVMPLSVQVIDSQSGTPIEGANILRIVCDIHDRSCKNLNLSRGQTDKNGRIKMEGIRKWGLWIPLPGGMPVPNHRIAIWKPGYKAFVFSQYGKITDINTQTVRSELKKVVQEIPLERKEYGSNDKPEETFIGGKIKLYRSSKSADITIGSAGSLRAP